MEYFCCWRKIYFINEPRFWNILDFSLRKKLGFGIYFSGKFAQNGIFHENVLIRKFCFSCKPLRRRLKNRRDAMSADRKRFLPQFCLIIWSPGKRMTQKDKLKLNEFQSKCIQLRTMTKQSSLTDYVTRKINWFLINLVE